MIYKIGVTLLSFGVLAACEPVPQSGTDAGIGNYFGAHVGRQAGRADALASLCPSLQFNTTTFAEYRAARCQRQGEAEGCSLPALDTEKSRAMASTLASLQNHSAEQVCAIAVDEAKSDEIFARYFIGLPVVRVAPPVIIAPVVEVVVEEPEPVVEEPEPVVEEPEPVVEEPEVVEEPAENIESPA